MRASDMVVSLRQLVVVAAIVTTAACSSGQSDGVQRPESSASVTSAAPAVEASPDSALKRFLSLAIATRENRANINEVWTCDEQLGYDDTRWIADYLVLTTTTRGDSAFATTTVTTVARQIDMGKGWVATLKTSEDTAHFILLRNKPDQQWRVCGDAREGFGVVMVGRDIQWQAGASPAKAHAVIDSVRQARGLEIIR
jgi:hypothetical protein